MMEVAPGEDLGNDGHLFATPILPGHAVRSASLRRCHSAACPLRHRPPARRGDAAQPAVSGTDPARRAAICPLRAALGLRGAGCGRDRARHRGDGAAACLCRGFQAGEDELAAAGGADCAACRARCRHPLVDGGLAGCDRYRAGACFRRLCPGDPASDAAGRGCASACALRGSGAGLSGNHLRGGGAVSVGLSRYLRLSRFHMDAWRACAG